jgi:hypothetical protein
MAVRAYDTIFHDCYALSITLAGKALAMLATH